MMRRFATLLSIAAIAVGILIAPAARAASIVEQIGCDLTTIDANGVVTVNRACQITDFINLFIYLAKWGMSILAVLAVGMLVYGGIQFITAGGRPSKVDEGRRVITGTVIGVIITLTAYIIINTTVTAITGSTIKVKSSNFFGVVGSLFSENPSVTIQGQTVPIERPFSDNQGASSGTGTTGGTLAACRTSTDWNQNCQAGSGGSALELFCADGPSGSTITNLQTALNEKGCDCGTVDGCFGTGTVACVRRFQIANGLPASGAIDATTKNKIDNGGVACDSDASTVAALLPSPVQQKPSNSGTGCCIVGSGVTSYYCLDHVSAQTCSALGADSEFTQTSSSCISTPSVSSRCGYCTNSYPPTTNDLRNACANNTTPYWCQSVIKNTYTPNNTPTFAPGASCNGACNICVTTVVNSL